jgi:dual oxidase
LPKFQDWCFKTIPGLTGVILLLLMCLLCVFATPYARRHTFQAFWATHSLYPLIYLLMVLHGLGKLIQPPIFLRVMALPLCLFALDRLISLSRKKIELCAVGAQLHLSDVTFLQLKRPTNFSYRSGQWARIACLKLNRNEYHPFTLASAPHEDHLQFYIRAVGPFTKNLRQMIANLPKQAPLPSFYLDGPYGEGHQDWSKYEVSILVGGGIGVTPFASILKDIAFRSKHLSQIACRRVSHPPSFY